MGRSGAKLIVKVLAGILMCAGVTLAQEASVESTVPRVIQFSGVLKSSVGQPLTGVQGVSFALYREQEGGSPLWIESQNVAADELGRFAVLLGAMTNGGVPVELFASGKSRWLGVQPLSSSESGGEVEMPRVLFVSVPYALKASDAETLGGLPASAFLLADTNGASPSGARLSRGETGDEAAADDGSSDGYFFNTAALAGLGTMDRVALWTDNSGTLGDSALLNPGGISGNVAIASSAVTPTKKLTIAGVQDTTGLTPGATTAGIELSNNGGGSVPGREATLSFANILGQAASRYAAISGLVTASAGTTQRGSLIFSTKALLGDTTLTERMRIDHNGFVGIGTSTPGAQLHIKPSGSVIFNMDRRGTGIGNGESWALSIQNAAASDALSLGQSSTTYTTGGALPWIGNSNAFLYFNQSQQFRLGAGVGTTPYLTVAGDSGNVGIGTDSPTEKLDIVGNLKVSGDFIGTFNTTGIFALPNTADASTGVLTVGGSPFLHNFGTNNTFLGENAGNFTLSGDKNTALGAFALDANTYGGDNTAVGVDALGSNTTGLRNTAVGAKAMLGNTTGQQNTAIGHGALLSNTTGNFNTAVGVQSSGFNTDGIQNTAIGYGSLNFNTSGNDNTAVGVDALFGNSTGANNTAVGKGAMRNGEASNNTAVGKDAMRNTDASDNTAMGAFALDANTTGASNTAVGKDALGANTIASFNTALGDSALFSNTSGWKNTAVGSNALAINTTGDQNTAVGENALGDNSTGANNTAVGMEALYSNHASSNTAMGAFALDANTTGDSNTAVGRDALGANTTASGNTAVGNATLNNNTTGAFNTAVGLTALASTSTGNNNTAVGGNALLTNTTGSSNTAIGSTADVSAGNLTNATAIGANALVSQSNSLVLGSINGVNGAASSVNVGIGTTNPADLLDVNGDVRVGTGSTGCVKDSDATVIAGTCSSDARLKRNIQPFPNLLDKVAQLQPVYFNWRTEEFPERHFGSGRTFGLIAQEVEEVLPEMVTEDEDGYKAVNYSKLPLLMLQAIREMKTKRQALAAAVEERQDQIEGQNKQIEQLITLVEILQAEVAELKGQHAAGPQLSSR